MPIEPIVLIHGYSAESVGTGRSDVTDIYGSLPSYLQKYAVAVDVSRYLSLDDGTGIDDISLALDLAIRRDYPDLLNTGFNVIIHSTGALVIRNWIRRFAPKPPYADGAAGCPVKRIIHLAGANLGSGWAHVGETDMVKWLRVIFQKGSEQGLAVLNSLELGSTWTLDLHRYFLLPGQNMQTDYGVLEFNIVGSQVPPEWLLIPIRYGKEDGSDGVVRVSASNLNFNYLRIGPCLAANASGASSGGYEFKESSSPGSGSRPVIPFAIPYNCAHSTATTGIVYGSQTRQDVLPLIELALATTAENYGTAVDSFNDLTQRTYSRVLDTAHEPMVRGLIDRLGTIAKGALQGRLSSPQAQYDKHAQVIIRVLDQNGQPVNRPSIYFNSAGGSGAPQQLIGQLFEDTHINQSSPNIATYYVRVECYDGGTNAFVPQIPSINGVNLEIEATDPNTQNVTYLPMSFSFSTDQLQQWIQPHRTTVIDVELLRLPSNDTFLIFEE